MVVAKAPCEIVSYSKLICFILCLGIHSNSSTYTWMCLLTVFSLNKVVEIRNVTYVSLIVFSCISVNF